MAQYKCENCNELRDSVICPKCGADTHLVDEPLPDEERAAGAASAPEPLRESVRTARPRPRPRLVAPDTDTASAERPNPEPRPREPQPQPQPQAQAPAESDVVGLEEF